MEIIAEIAFDGVKGLELVGFSDQSGNILLPDGSGLAKTFAGPEGLVQTVFQRGFLRCMCEFNNTPVILWVIAANKMIIWRNRRKGT